MSSEKLPGRKVPGESKGKKKTKVLRWPFPLGNFKPTCDGLPGKKSATTKEKGLQKRDLGVGGGGGKHTKTKHLIREKVAKRENQGHYPSVSPVRRHSRRKGRGTGRGEALNNHKGRIVKERGRRIFVH